MYLIESGQWEMRIDFTKADGSFSYVHYNQFKVRSASEEYKLTVDGYTGVDGDYFTEINLPASNRKFTTFDNDNDLQTSLMCTTFYGGGW